MDVSLGNVFDVIAWLYEGRLLMARSDISLLYRELKVSEIDAPGVSRQAS